MKTKTINSTTECAKLIRAELKKTYPHIKFSVIKRHYSCINVDYSGDLLINEVDNLLEKYRNGYFNGMEDIHEYKSSKDITVEYTCKYVFVHRNYTDEEIEKAKLHIVKCTNITPQELEINHNFLSFWRMSVHEMCIRVINKELFHEHN